MSKKQEIPVDNELVALRDALRRFAEERDWEQFHSPKNLAMALVAEAGELVEQFQWLSEADSYAPSDSQRRAIEDELADVMIYLIRLADKLGMDLVCAAEKKLEQNHQKYPVDRVRGSARKYTDYE